MYDDIGYTLAWKMVAISEALVGLFVLLALAWNLISNTIKTGAMKPFDTTDFIRVLVIAFAVGLFVPIMYMPKTLVNAVENATRLSDSDKLAYAEKLQQLSSKSGTVGEINEMTSNDPEDVPNSTEDDVDFSFIDFFSTSNFGVDNLFNLIINGLSSAIILLVRYIIMVVLRVLEMCLFIIGPFALAASILPIWRDKFVVWFNTWITVNFSFVIFNILDSVMFFGLMKDINVDGIGNEPIISVAFNLSIIALYIMPMWMAGKVVGSSDAGRFLSTVASIGTVAATKGLSAMSGATGAATATNTAGAAAQDMMKGGLNQGAAKIKLDDDEGSE